MKEENRTNILKAALRVFAKKGYHGSSIFDITKEAGVSKALFYHYFKNKKDLLVIFAEKRLQDYLSLAKVIKEIKDPKEKILFLVNYALDELAKETEKLRFYNMLYLTEDGVKAIEIAMKTYQEKFEQIFEMERNFFSELGFTDPDMEATYMRSILQGISLEYMLGPAEYPLEEMREKLLARYY